MKICVVVSMRLEVKYVSSQLSSRGGLVRVRVRVRVRDFVLLGAEGPAEQHVVVSAQWSVVSSK